MAIIRFSLEGVNEPPLIEEVEVRVWGSAGTQDQEFCISSGFSMNSKYHIWLEIIHSINGAQLFYTRTILQARTLQSIADDIRKFSRGEQDCVGFGDIMPHTYIFLEREPSAKKKRSVKEIHDCGYQLKIFIDDGAVLRSDPPGETGVQIKFDFVTFQQGIKFIRDLDREFVRSASSKHPNPAKLPAGSSFWLFSRQLNQAAYNCISKDYQEDYFRHPLVAPAIEDWLRRLPAGGHVLDAGCGHGDPVVPHLLERGFRVTGSDFSPAMLKRARERFPQAQFQQCQIADIDEENLYDGACSFHAMLYQDPVDLFHSIYRLWRALKPGGLLFLFASDAHPNWRGFPLRPIIGEQMWSWNYGMEEAAQALGEHGFFKVLSAKNLTTNEERLSYYQLRRKDKGGAAESPPPDPQDLPDNLPYSYAILARKQSNQRRVISPPPAS